MEDEIRSIADEQFQRNVWFGGSTQWVDSPDEQFCRFFDDADVAAFLALKDNGLKPEQQFQLARLSGLMRILSENTPSSIRPEELIDDPRWVEIRKQAVLTLGALLKND